MKNTSNHDTAIRNGKRRYFKNKEKNKFIYIVKKIVNALRRIWMGMTEYCESSTIHGLKYLVEPNRSKVERYKSSHYKFMTLNKI